MKQDTAHRVGGYMSATRVREKTRVSMARYIKAFIEHINNSDT